MFSLWLDLNYLHMFLLNVWVFFLYCLFLNCFFLIWQKCSAKIKRKEKHTTPSELSQNTLGSHVNVPSTYMHYHSDPWLIDTSIKKTRLVKLVVLTQISSVSDMMWSC